MCLGEGMVDKTSIEIQKKGYTFGQGKRPWFCPWQAAVLLNFFVLVS